MNTARDLPPALDTTELARFVDRTWDEQIVPALVHYITIPAKSPMFDPEWQAHGHIERVIHIS